MYKLFAFKQKLLGRKNEKEGIKWHMVLHMPLYIRLFGPSAVFDMIKYEKYHSNVKVLFDMTSKRFGTTNDEIMGKIVVGKALENAMPEEPDLLRPEKILRFSSVDNFYTTEGNILFSTTPGVKNREQILFQQGRFLLPDNPSFINPIADENIFSNTITSYMEYLRNNDVQLGGM